jgi:Protein of unknown function (DUF3800)
MFIKEYARDTVNARVLPLGLESASSGRDHAYDEFFDALSCAYTGDELGKLIMGIWAYFDESGTHDGAPRMVVAGYVSTTERWRAFKSAWATFLKEDCGGIEYFHSKEHVGPAEDAISKRAVAIIGDAIECGGGVTINPLDFADLTTPKVRKAFGNVYEFCCDAMLETMIDLPQVRAMKGKITYVFARGAPHWKKFDNRLHKIEHNDELKFRYNTHFFHSMTDAPPLQSADILANLMYRTYRDAGNFNEGSRHPVLAALVKSKPRSHFLQDFDREEIERIVWNSENPDRLRKRKQ